MKRHCSLCAFCLSSILMALLTCCDSGSNADADADADSDADADGDADDELCDPRDCGEPPDPECANDSTLIFYSGPARCVDNQCVFSETESLCNEPPEDECEGEIVRTYAETGSCTEGACEYELFEDVCDLGCCSDRCCEMVPSNSEDFGTFEETEIDATVPSEMTFDTNSDCVSPSSLGLCELVEVEGAPDVCVCKSDSVTIRGDLSVVGSAALAILASRTVVIEGSLSVAASYQTPGPGCGWEYIEAGSSNCAGGSYGTSGGWGVDPLGNEELIPLVGGMIGQHCSGSEGGGGGGAVQISAGESIDIEGLINAGGGGGQGGGCCCRSYHGGAGGGSGGGVLLEAPELSITGTVAANGGGGGGGGYTEDSSCGGWGSRGGDAATDEQWTSGGAGNDDHGCIASGYTSGGDGGSGAYDTHDGRSGGSSDSANCTPFGDYHRVGQGGGGGGVGRIRINTAGSCMCGGTITPPPTYGDIEAG